MGDNGATSLVLKNVKAKQKQDQDTLSAEDLAWADSCLIEDPEMSETNMDSIKEALLDILGILGPSTNEQDNPKDVTSPQNFPAVVEEGTSETADSSMDEHPEDEIPDMLSPLKQPFLPNYNDEMMNVQYSDSDDDVVGFTFSDSVTEPPSGDIFKVWDLDIPVEEDGLVKELKEALSSDAATGMKGVKRETLDSLVEGKGSNGNPYNLLEYENTCFALGKDVSRAKSFDEKHGLASTTFGKVTSLNKKIGFTEKVSTGASIINGKIKEVDEKLQVSEKAKLAFAIAEHTLSNARDLPL
ncbi:hypothetical protein OSB04_021798 [Centaurea solstitialis]|uniref:Uncharacterized protein n=1 Tax=Centaurea solstitialis TaxID=347529 RepID=A0AA38SUV3_9ASTR|nr:hypothetical protein OSB04_021798 [Centaurea solstitialis]